MDNVNFVRGMLANHAMDELWNKTRKLADIYGIDGAILYLNAQIQFLRDVRDAQENEEGEGDDCVDNI